MVRQRCMYLLVPTLKVGVEKVTYKGVMHVTGSADMWGTCGLQERDGTGTCLP